MNQDELIFSSNKDIRKSVDNEVLNFWHLRKKAELDVKYDNSNNHKISLHSFRAFFETQASNTHGLEYAHALIGHSGYLEQYYRLSEEDRLEKYIELEPKITIGEDFKNKIKKQNNETDEIKTKLENSQKMINDLKLNQEQKIDEIMSMISILKKKMEEPDKH